MKCRECTSLDVTAYKLPLTVNVVKLLRAMRNKGSANVDVFWIRQQGFGNATSIAKYFGLVKDSGERDRMWSITEHGLAFLKGGKIPSWVKHFDGEVYEQSKELLGVDEVKESSNFVKVDPPAWLLEQRRERYFKQEPLL